MTPRQPKHKSPETGIPNRQKTGFNPTEVREQGVQETGVVRLEQGPEAVVDLLAHQDVGLPGQGIDDDRLRLRKFLPLCFSQLDLVFSFPASYPAGAGNGKARPFAA